MNYSGFVLVAIGLFFLCGAASDWDWLIVDSKTKLFIDLFGRSFVRFFYGLLGAFLVIMGILIALQIIQFYK